MARHIERLGQLLWAVVGTVATRPFMPERSTQDLAIAVLAKDAAEVRRRLRAAGYAYFGRTVRPAPFDPAGSGPTRKGPLERRSTQTMLVLAIN